MQLTEHPLRRELVREMHLRRFASVDAPSRIVQIVLLVDDTQRDAERDLLSAAAERRGAEFDRNPRHLTLDLGDGQTFMWERHTEATTLTAISVGDELTRLEETLSWMGDWPGAVVRATKVYVEPTEDRAEVQLPGMEFVAQDMVTCRVKSDVRIWSDFGIRDDGFGRLLVSAGQAEADELGRIIQQLQELGNYRNLALLGLPEVRREMPVLENLEQRLAAYSGELGDPHGTDEDLLLELSRLSAELAQVRVKNAYRLSASSAYAQIAADRLEGLEIRPIDGFQSLTNFTERRLVPAMRTCETFVERLRRLSERSGDAIALLNTRIDTRIKAQNLDLLKSMESSFNLQLRLQNLVEALSVVAASYYAVGLLAFILKGAKPWVREDDVGTILALATPFIIVSMFLAVSWLRNRFIREKQIGPTNETGPGEYEGETINKDQNRL